MISDKNRDRAYQYAKYYHLTKCKKDYLKKVMAHVGEEYLEEAEFVWEAIDQWEGEVNPR